MRTFKLALLPVLVMLAISLIAEVQTGSADRVKERGALTLIAPRLIAYAAEEDALSMLAKEAGITAYVHISGTVDLKNADGVFQIREAGNEKYAIGTVRSQTYYGEEVHLYVNSEGWFIAYYPKTTPVAQIIDWAAYASAPKAIPTKLEKVLDDVVWKVASQTPIQVNYYHFDCPNATHLMFVVDRGGFTIQLPDTFTFYEISGALSASDSRSYLTIQRDTTTIETVYAGGRKIDLTKMRADNQPYTISIPDGVGGLALVYKTTKD